MAYSSIPRASPRNTAIGSSPISSTLPASSGAHAAKRHERRPVSTSRSAARMAELADLRPILRRVADGATLSESEAAKAFGLIMSGGATEAQIGARLMALRVRGETGEEIAGAARALQ